METNQTPEAKIKADKLAAKKALKKELRAERAVAFEVIKKLVDEQKDKSFEEALKKIRPSMYGLTIQRAGGAANAFLELVAKTGTVSEDEVFKQLKVGRKECAGHIRKSLKKSEPNDRKWISFDIKTGIYKVAGTGANPPRDWTGYVPAEESLDLSKKSDSLK